MRNVRFLSVLILICLFLLNTLNTLALDNVSINKDFNNSRFVITSTNNMLINLTVSSFLNVNTTSNTQLVDEEEPLGGFSVFAPFLTIIVLVLGIVLLIYILKSD